MTETKQIAEELRQKGGGEDTVLAHITPHEAELLKMMGGTGKENPETGLPEYRSWWTKIRRYVVAAVVAIVAPYVAPMIGGALGLTGVAADVAGAAVFNAGVAAAGGANRNDILKAGLTGGASAGIGAIAGDLGTGDLAKQYGLSDTAQAGISGFTKGAITGTSSGLLQGKNLSDSLQSGAIQGGVGAISGMFYPTDSNSDWASKLGSAGANAAVTYGLQQLFSPSGSGQGATSYSPTVNLGGAPQQNRVGSQALAQTLGVGDPSKPEQGGDVSKKARNVWNQSSLKTTDEIGSSNG